MLRKSPTDAVPLYARRALPGDEAEVQANRGSKNAASRQAGVFMEDLASGIGKAGGNFRRDQHLEARSNQTGFRFQRASSAVSACGLAVMLRKLNPETLLCIGHTLQHGKRRRKLPPASCTHGNPADGANHAPYPEMAF